ncbi:MAG: arsenate reductase (glutaredoxin) [Euryarchaeota archaeon]|nr:arsenate reductase (glutaredoxin) [Euryarchaeota archaeon]
MNLHPFNGENMQYKLFHNPRCSKSRQAKNLLEEKNISFETILYLVNPLKENELEQILINLTTNPNSLVRIKEKLFKELNINIEKLDDGKFVAKLLAKNPKLMERPLLTTPNKAIIGRPPENFLEII